MFREVGYGYVSRPDGEKVTPSWLKEGNYQIESRGRKYEVNSLFSIFFDLFLWIDNKSEDFDKFPFPGHIAYENTIWPKQWQNTGKPQWLWFFMGFER